MANPDHIELLHQGAQIWNQWRRENRIVRPDLRGANLREANLSKINLSGAILNRANLKGADLSFANLSEADLSRVNFSKANLSYAYLNSAYLHRANLIGANLNRAYLSDASLGGANLSNANLNRVTLIRASLMGVTLCRANLSKANLSQVHLNHANLSGANLSDANLSGAQALDTDFSGTTFTGAGIQDWSINSRTSLQNVVCQHIFTRYAEENGELVGRRPHDPNQIFLPGEFTKRYQVVLDSVDLFFNDGIDWTAFVAALEDLQIQYGNELAIQAIERKAGSAFLVRLEIPPSTDPCMVEQEAKECYAAWLQLVEAQYRTGLLAKDKEIALHKQQSADLLKLAKLAANKPIEVAATTTKELTAKALELRFRPYASLNGHSDSPPVAR
jgi:uncharacterized protein YjbI with pentapeptide repeats